MGSALELLVPEGRAAEAAATAREHFAVWEATLSRFRAGSELCRLGARAGRAVPVSALLFAAVSEALRAARATGGLFDPGLGRQISRLGYDRSFVALPGDAACVPASGVAGGAWRWIELDAAARTVRLPIGLALDLGGIAKGLAVDACLERLGEMGIAPALVSAGGDLAVTGVPPACHDWIVALPEAGPHATIALRRGALATSSTRGRRWRRGGALHHHLLDPTSGLPARSGVCAVSVAADRCAQAEVAAKCAVLLGPVEGARFLEERCLPGLLVEDDGTTHPVAGWPRTATPAAVA
jgi:thiamine biosynthesis lipoprotein